MNRPVASTDLTDGDTPDLAQVRTETLMPLGTFLNGGTATQLRGLMWLSLSDIGQARNPRVYH